MLAEIQLGSLIAAQSFFGGKQGQARLNAAALHFDRVAVRHELLRHTQHATVVVCLHAFEDVHRRRFAPRVERGEPTLVAATLLEQRPDFVQRAVRIGHRDSSRGWRSAATSPALNSFNLYQAQRAVRAISSFGMF